MSASVVALPRGRGRPSNADLAERVARQARLLADARAERHALHAERRHLAAVVRAGSRRIELAIHAGRPDVALHVAGQLDALAERLDPQRPEVPA